MEEMATGFRFYPTEEELITFYLHNKLEDSNSKINRVIPVLDIYQLEPWDLPRYCGELCRGDTEQWFFFMPRQEREARGGRPNRTTESGYWKATGSLSHVYTSDSKVIGVKKTMVFYKGKAPIGTKTKWKMNEYRAIKHDLSTSIPKLRDEVSLCRVYVVSGSLRAFDRRPTQAAETCSSSREVAVVNEENNKVITAVSGDGDAADQLQERSSSGSSFIMQGNQATVEDAGEMSIDDLENFMGYYETQSP